MMKSFLHYSYNSQTKEVILEYYLEAKTVL